MGEKELEGLLNQSRAPLTYLTYPNQYPQEVIDKILEIKDKTTSAL